MGYWEGDSRWKTAPVYIDSESQTDIPKFAPIRKLTLAMLALTLGTPSRTIKLYE